MKRVAIVIGAIIVALLAEHQLQILFITCILIAAYAVTKKDENLSD